MSNEWSMPFNLMAWIDENRDALKPPVCNRQVFTGSEFIVMIVGGPNARKDYHYDVAPEFFYQLRGDMVLHVMDDGRRRSIDIREGDVFMLPAGMPHSPQRFADTVGLVVERQRKPDELDGFMWFCEQCDNKLYEEFLHVSDIVEDLPPVFDRFYNDIEARTCKQCGAVLSPD
jgi:3-hydroxyanthranilate 3,4-dioxygenase